MVFTSVSALQLTTFSRFLNRSLSVQIRHKYINIMITVFSTAHYRAGLLKVRTPVWTVRVFNPDQTLFRIERPCVKDSNCAFHSLINAQTL